MELKPIHYIVWRAHWGGAELTVNYYIHNFSSQRKLHIYSIRGDDNQIYDESKVAYEQGGSSNWQCYVKYFKYCRKNRNHVFHLVNAGVIILCITLLAGVKKPVFHIHGTIHWKSTLKKWFFKPIWAWISLHKVTYLAVSEHAAEVFSRDALPIKPMVIHNGIEVEKFWLKKSMRGELRRIGYIGRLYAGKNVDLVIRLFEEIAAEFPQVELHIAGDGPLRPALEAQAAESPYSDRIVFHGFVKDMAWFYSSIDLFLFLSAHESFGLVLVEALLTGLPILTSDVPAFKEIYGDDHSFLLGSPADYAQLKQNFLSAVNQYPGLAEKAFVVGDQMKERFSIQKHLTEIESLYEKY